MSVARPSDILKGRSRLVEELARDLDPGSRESIVKILRSWKEGESGDELERLVGKRLSRRLLAELST